jgi:hypothetical protein
MPRRRGCQTNSVISTRSAQQLEDSPGLTARCTARRADPAAGRPRHAGCGISGIEDGARFVVTTGDIADPETQRFIGESGLPVLLKPFELRALVEAVAS